MYAILSAIQYKTSFFTGFSNRIYVSMDVIWAIVEIQSRIKNNWSSFHLRLIMDVKKNYRNFKKADIERKIN